VGRQFDPNIVDLFGTNDRVALVIEEALRERPVPEAQGVVQTGALSADSLVQSDGEASKPKRRWVPRPSMEQPTDQSPRFGDEKRTA
jgi:hypothetical protein